MDDEEEADGGAPRWMTTFADLMSLLLTFFVLLLSFSVMDAEKYKQLAGQMRAAFGLQPVFELSGVREMDGTILHDQVRNITPITTQFMTPRDSLIEGSEDEDQPSIIDTKRSTGSDRPIEISESQITEWQDRQRQQGFEEVVDRIQQALRDEMLAADVVVEMRDGGVVIRFPEKLAFPSGSDDLQDGFRNALARVAPILEELDGQIVVAGHSDNVPISGGRFRSNWALSASRAESVVDYLMGVSNVPGNKLAIHSYADTRPLAPNDTPENRALNRRVEVIITEKDVI